MVPAAARPIATDSATAFRAKRSGRGTIRPSSSAMTEHQGSAPEEDGEAEALRHDYVLNFRRQIEERAFADLMSWVPTLIEGAVYQTKTKSFRRLREDFSHPELHENLIITPTGAVAIDIQGKSNTRSPIDLVIEHHASIDDVVGAALWLAEQLGIDENERRAMGYRDGETLTPFTKVKQAAGKLKPGDIDGAKEVLDQLVAIENRTPATDDIIVGLVKEKLGPPVTLKSLRAILKGAKRQAAKAELDRDANEAGKAARRAGFARTRVGCASKSRPKPGPNGRPYAPRSRSRRCCGTTPARTGG